MTTTLPPEQATSSQRRTVIKWLLGFSIISTLAGVLTPIIGYLWPPARRSTGEGSRIKVASLSELRAVGGMVVPVENEPVVLHASEDGGIHAFSAICTHLGCVSKWESAGGYILCPCHDGRFNAKTGAVISGPPPGPLPQYDVVIEDDDIYVVL